MSNTETPFDSNTPPAPGWYETAYGKKWWNGYAWVVPKRGMAIASMVLGCVAWGIALLTFFMGSFISLVVSLVGLPLGFIALKKEPSGRGFAITGIVLNTIGVGLGVVFVALMILGTFVGGVSGTTY